MKKHQRVILLIAPVLILAALLLFARSAPGQGTYENLIQNGAFAPDGEGGASAWYTDEYFHQPGYTLYEVGEEDGFSAAHIRNDYPNDARFAQSVSVSPDTLYCLRGFVKAQAAGGLGANLSVEGIYVFSESVYDTQGEWQEVRLYGRTGESQRRVTVFARLGGYSGEATGEAWFRDVTLNRVDSVPAGYAETLWDKPQAAADAPSVSTGTLPLLLAVLGWGALAVLAFLYLRREQPLSRPARLSWLWLSLILLLGLGARVLCALLIPGYDVDIGCFRSWASVMAEKGPGAFYASVGFCDYPPGYLWILGALGWIGKILGAGVTEFMVKLPPILADLALCGFLYREARRLLGDKSALCLTLLYALNPLMIQAGAAWGQADGVMALLLFLTVVYAVKGKWKAALPCYMAAVLVKPQALMFGPLGLLALITRLYQARKDKDRAVLKDAGVGMGLLLAVLAALALPFTGSQSADWLFSLYGNTMSQYAYATVNACNVYFLLGKNWVGADTLLSGQWPLVTLSYFLAVLPLLPGLLRSPVLRKENQESRDKVRVWVLCGLALSLLGALLILGLSGGLTYASLGTAMVVYCVTLFAALYLLGRDIRNLPLFGAGLLLMLFNTASRMHERYLAPAVALLLLSYALKKDRRILYLAALVTAAGFLNVGCVLDRNIRIGGASAHLNAPAYGISSDMTFLETLSALGNCLAGLASLWLCEAVSRGDVRSFAAAPGAAADASAPRVFPLPLMTRDTRLSPRDWAVMLGATALYAVLAFANLGSTKAPQTEFLSAEPGEAILIDLGEEHTFTALYYPGIHHNYNGTDGSETPASFTVQYSRDGQTWVYAGSGAAYNGDCFKWKYLTQTPVTARYVRLTAESYRLSLFELLFRDADTGEGILPVSVTDSLDNESARYLADEPDSLEGEPGWYNSTYFDEIYHARTAYEHLHGLYPYETTHPPLGKVMMSWCVAIFGMTPFGWRFAGALAGVLMLPGMYLLGRLLIRRKWGGIAAMGLMALDLMHYTQTRIATIDSFVVLFIIWMTYFMLRWFFLDYFETPFWKTLIPLALSGLMMGLGVASKWTGCYAGAGLAVIFFFGVYRRWREIKAARAIPQKQRSIGQTAAAEEGIKRLLITLGCCLIFFVAAPLLIYYLSYIPYFAPSGGVSVEKVIQAAEGMLAYHSEPGRGMDHYFYSPWYQWPIIFKPMWYASSAYEPAGYQSSIMAMGNPAVWWVGLLGLFGVMCLWAGRHWRRDSMEIAWHPAQDDPRFALLLILFAAQYLPWMLVPRGTYIYHYFPSVPFIILCTVLCLDRLSDKWEKAARIALAILLIAALALFIAFFPYASGVAVSQAWMDRMKWFPNWLWY